MIHFTERLGKGAEIVNRVDVFEPNNSRPDDSPEERAVIDKLLTVEIVEYERDGSPVKVKERLSRSAVERELAARRKQVAELERQLKLF